MTTARLLLAAGELRLPIRLEAPHAPQTTAALLRSLPARIDLHCAKIAGNHILWHAPFVVDAEATGDVMQVPPGGFLYWPERQFLELVFDALQAENAQVTLLGRLTGDVEVLCGLGRHVQARQGHQPLWAELTAIEAPAPQPARRPHTELAELIAARRAIWREAPAEIAALLARRGVMLPAGPLIYAEGYARHLHETLWRHRAIARGGDAAFAAHAALHSLRFAASRLAGFCHLTENGATLTRFAAALESHPTLTAAILDEAILFAGRLAAWLDARIAWDDLTDATRAAHADWKD